MMIFSTQRSRSCSVVHHRGAIQATTRLTHSLPIAPNLLDQAFAVTVLNQAWCDDIRYIATKPSKPHKSMPQKPC
ncbi:hypothetical protein F6X40_26465 [Paraburkholderia sp. UCT31]|nr:hypothetical protein [Paraburkholderia sp. UCT31]